MNFNAGDRVKMISVDGEYQDPSFGYRIGRIGVIDSFGKDLGGDYARVTWDDDGDNNSPYLKNLKLISSTEKGVKQMKKTRVAYRLKPGVDITEIPYCSIRNGITEETVLGCAYKYNTSQPSKKVYQTLEEFNKDINQPIGSWTCCWSWDTINKYFQPIGGDNMTTLKKLSNFLKTTLVQPIKDYYRLGWVEIRDDELTVTESGKTAFIQEQVVGKGDLAKVAAAKIKEAEAEEAKKNK